MTDKILRILAKTLIRVFIILLMAYLFVTMREAGYKVFSDKAYDGSENAKEAVLTVEKDESLLDIGKELEKMDIVDNAYLFALSLRCMEGYQNIQPGEYVVKASQKPSEILSLLINREEWDE